MKWIKKAYYSVLFIGYYLIKLISANLNIAYDILTPKMHFNPGMIELDLKLSNRFGMLMFSNLVSMTPGTLSTDLNLETNKLLVHVLYMDRREMIENEMEQIMERIRRITE